MATRRTIFKAFGGSRRQPDVSVALCGRDPRFWRASNRGASVRERGTRVFRVWIGRMRRGPADGRAGAKALTDRGDDLNVQRSKDRFPLI